MSTKVFKIKKKIRKAQEGMVFELTSADQLQNEDFDKFFTSKIEGEKKGKANRLVKAKKDLEGLLSSGKKIQVFANNTFKVLDSDSTSSNEDFGVQKDKTLGQAAGTLLNVGNVKRESEVIGFLSDFAAKNPNVFKPAVIDQKVTTEQSPVEQKEEKPITEDKKDDVTSGKKDLSELMSNYQKSIGINWNDISKRGKSSSDRRKFIYGAFEYLKKQDPNLLNFDLNEIEKLFPVDRETYLSSNYRTNIEKGYNALGFFLTGGVKPSQKKQPTKPKTVTYTEEEKAAMTPEQRDVAEKREKGIESDKYKGHEFRVEKMLAFREAPVTFRNFNPEQRRKPKGPTGSGGDSIISMSEEGTASEPGKARNLNNVASFFKQGIYGADSDERGNYFVTMTPRGEDGTYSFVKVYESLPDFVSPFSKEGRDHIEIIGESESNEWRNLVIEMQKRLSREGIDFSSPTGGLQIKANQKGGKTEKRKAGFFETTGLSPLTEEESPLIKEQKKKKSPKKPTELVKKAKEKSSSLKEGEVSDKKTAEPKTAMDDIMSEMSGADKAKFAAAMVDLTGTATAFIPGLHLASVATGAAASLTTFGANIADDGFQLKDLGNLGIDLGLDALTLIGVGKVGKVARAVNKLKPILKVAQQAAQIKGYVDFVSSLNTILSKGPTNMTGDDWVQFANSIQGMTTGKRIKASGLQKKKMSLKEAEDLKLIDSKKADKIFETKSKTTILDKSRNIADKVTPSRFNLKRNIPKSKADINVEVHVPYKYQGIQSLMGKNWYSPKNVTAYLRAPFHSLRAQAGKRKQREWDQLHKTFGAVKTQVSKNQKGGKITKAQYGNILGYLGNIDFNDLVNSSSNPLREDVDLIGDIGVEPLKLPNVPVLETPERFASRAAYRKAMRNRKRPLRVGDESPEELLQKQGSGPSTRALLTSLANATLLRKKVRQDNPYADVDVTIPISPVQISPAIRAFRQRKINEAKRSAGRALTSDPQTELIRKQLASASARDQEDRLAAEEASSFQQQRNLALSQTAQNRARLAEHEVKLTDAQNRIRLAQEETDIQSKAAILSPLFQDAAAREQREANFASSYFPLLYQQQALEGSNQLKNLEAEQTKKLSDFIKANPNITRTDPKYIQKVRELNEEFKTKRTALETSLNTQLKSTLQNVALRGRLKKGGRLKKLISRAKRN